MTPLIWHLLNLCLQKAAVDEYLKASGLEVDGGLTVKWVADEAELAQCFAYGQEFGRKVLEKA